MAANEEPDVSIRARVNITDPRHGNNVTTKVLSSGGKFYISATGEIQSNGGRTLTSIWARTYTLQQNVNDDPGLPRPPEGYIDGENNINNGWCFYGSKTTEEDPPVSRLIEVADPNLNPTQYLYVWGQMEGGPFAYVDEVVMHLVIEDTTNSGDAEP
jgi:hypothetical protein